MDMKIETKVLQQLYANLPKPYSLNSDQIRASYQSFYDKLVKSYKNNDFRNIYNLLVSCIQSDLLLKFELPHKENDTFLVDFVNLLYSIITIYPVKYYQTQLTAVEFLYIFLEANKQISGLTLDWHPFYKIMKYYSYTNESFFLIGERIPHLKAEKNISAIYKIFELSLKISSYFPDEIETEINGQKVKTNTTEQLVKKFITHISPNGQNTPSYLVFFCYLCPPHKRRYKLFVNQLLRELFDTTNKKNANAIFLLFVRIIESNIEDDFTFLLPVLSQFLSSEVLFKKEAKYVNKFIITPLFNAIKFPTEYSEILARIVIALFMSPPTRDSILKLLENFFISIKSAIHPSVSTSEFEKIDHFMLLLTIYMRYNLRKLTDETVKTNKIFYDMKKDLWPSQAEIHEFISMLSEQNIMNIRKCFYPTQILIETTLDPLTIDHYFNTACQCINFMDTEENVSFSGWIMLSSLVMSIEKNEKILSNIENIIEMAANNFYRIELQYQISAFLNVFFSKVPFNKKDTLKGLENVNFPKLANLLFSNIINLFRTLPISEDKTVEIADDVSDHINSFTCSLFQYCDDEVRDEIMNIIISISTDEDLSQSAQYIQQIVFNYSIFASLKNVQQISDVYEKQIELKKNNPSMLLFLTLIYSNLLPAHYHSVESVKKCCDFILPFTKSDDKKIRKAAWESISSALRTCDGIANLILTIKKDKIVSNSFETVYFDDIDINWYSLPDLTDLSFEYFNPIYEKLLTMTDPHEINKLIKEIKSPLCLILQSTANSEGSVKDVVDQFFDDPIYNVPLNYRKSLPIKDKFVECALRILNDFPESEILIYNVVEISLNIFMVYNETSQEDQINSLENFYIPFDHSGKYFNKVFLDSAICDIYFKRRNKLIIPITDNIRVLLTKIFELSIWKSQSINEISEVIIYLLCKYYKPLLRSIISDVATKVTSNQANEFVNFMSSKFICDIIQIDYKLCSQLLLYVLNNLDLKDKEKLLNLKIFLKNICVSTMPIESPKENQEDFVNLLNEIEKNYLNKNQSNRTYNYILIHIIFMCLKHVNNVSDKILDYVMKSVTHFDEEISFVAEVCLSRILDTKKKFTKEKVEVKKFPTIAAFPNVFEQVTLKLQDDGIYFPTSSKTENVDTNDKVLFEEEEEEEEEFKDDNEGCYSLESDPTNSLDIRSHKRKENEDFKKIFESFNNIEIEWKSDTEYGTLFDSEFLFDRSNGYFSFRDHFYQKKYEFVNDQYLLDNMKDIFSSATYSINEKNMNRGVQYQNIWKRYALIVGPYCINTLNKLCIKYLSEYYSCNSLIVSKVLQGAISGIIANVCYWSQKDRLKLFKKVVLPVMCILLTNPNTVNFADTIISRAMHFTSPFCFAPLFKVLFDLASQGPNLPNYKRSLIKILAKQISIKPCHFFNSYDQLIEKFINPFIANMNEYNSNEVDNIVNFIFTMFIPCSLSSEKSPIYSTEIESKREKIIKIFDSLFDLKNDKMKRNLIHALTLSLSSFNSSSYDVKILLAPIFINRIHTIFNLLNSSNIKEEELFIKSTGSFIENPIFYMNTEIELKFVTKIIKELMNLSLPMQQILLENINKMIESNIFNIPRNDYDKYEKIFLDYGSFAKVNNLGNELRLKIAKILGIFEIRKNSNELFVDCDHSVDNQVLIAASIILNSFLFDRGNDKITKAFNLMEEKCTSKKSNDKEFFKSVSEIFIHRHTDHVLDDVEELIIQYKGLLAPSYIC